MNPDHYYQRSGGASVVGLMLALLAGLFGSAVLASLYNVLLFYLPYVKLSVLGAGLFAAGVGVVSRVGVSIGKVRSRWLACFVGLAIGFLAMYAAWVSFLFLLIYNTDGVMVWILDMHEMQQVMQRLAQLGWKNMQGTALYVLWGVEALAVMGTAAFMATTTEKPFCEACNQWCEEKPCPVTFSMPADFAALREALEADDYSALYGSAQFAPDADVYLQATLYPCPSCRATAWLKLDRVEAGVNDDGEVETKEETVLKYLDIPYEDYDRLMCLVPGSEAMPNAPGGSAESAPPEGDESPGG